MMSHDDDDDDGGGGDDDETFRTIPAANSESQDNAHTNSQFITEISG